MSKKLLSLVFGIMVLVGLAACTGTENEVSGYYVSVDINPSIEFVVNEEDIVESYLFLNDDAAVLCSDLDFVGMNVDDAIELFVETATAAGYIDPDGNDNAVLVTVLAEDEEDEDEGEGRGALIRERIRKRLNTHFAKNYINATVLSEDYTQEDLLAEADELGVSPGKLKLTYAALMTDDTLVKEEVLELPVKDILAIVREGHREAFSEFKEEKMVQLRERKQELIEQHKAEIEAFIAENPEMTEEEIQEYINQYKEDVKEETRERWQERIQNWQEKRENARNNAGNSQDEEETE